MSLRLFTNFAESNFLSFSKGGQIGELEILIRNFSENIEKRINGP